jgi:hypothetical protein
MHGLSEVVNGVAEEEFGPNENGFNSRAQIPRWIRSSSRQTG